VCAHAARVYVSALLRVWMRGCVSACARACVRAWFVFVCVCACLDVFVRSLN
jgi:hypothetical protein